MKQRYKKQDISPCSIARKKNRLLFHVDLIVICLCYLCCNTAANAYPVVDAAEKEKNNVVDNMRATSLKIKPIVSNIRNDRAHKLESNQVTHTITNAKRGRINLIGLIVGCVLISLCCIAYYSFRRNRRKISELQQKLTIERLNKEYFNNWLFRFEMCQ